jgi:L-fucose mutarotase
MLKSPLLHPQILHALGRAGHGSKVLISDGNYPHSTQRGPNAELVFMNLVPGLINCTDALNAIASAIPIEAATVMAPARSGPHAMAKDPDIFAEFSSLLKSTDCRGDLIRLDRMAFYEAGRQPDVCLCVATGEQRIYANLLLTIGVVL